MPSTDEGLKEKIAAILRKQSTGIPFVNLSLERAEEIMAAIGSWYWKDPVAEPPPDDAHGLVILVELTCDCGKGGRVALSAGRMGGEWIIPEFDHSFDIKYWLTLPAYPER